MGSGERVSDKQYFNKNLCNIYNAIYQPSVYSLPSWIISLIDVPPFLCSAARSISTRPKGWWRSCLISCLQRTRARTRRSSRMGGPRISSPSSLWTTVSLFERRDPCSKVKRGGVAKAFQLFWVLFLLRFLPLSQISDRRWRWLTRNAEIIRENLVRTTGSDVLKKQPCK